MVYAHIKQKFNQMSTCSSVNILKTWAWVLLKYGKSNIREGNMRMNDMWKIVLNNKFVNNCEMLWACGESYSRDGEGYCWVSKELIILIKVAYCQLGVIENHLASVSEVALIRLSQHVVVFASSELMQSNFSTTATAEGAVVERCLLRRVWGVV